MANMRLDLSHCFLFVLFFSKVFLSLNGTVDKKLQIKRRLEELDAEEAKISERLKELLRIQGRVLDGVPKYQPKLIEELSETAAHAILYHRHSDLQSRKQISGQV